ncbi:MAG TPA: c-type cytochrome biogenesis protein CcsB [Jatrophihabitantaceae bacterium]|nr:c-type cytochrome biogenesis protein CcsB [Jatrophihabitantaceae bacterium]
MINSGMAHLSDALFTTAIATYSVGIVGYAGEYAFGRRGRVAESAAVAVDQRVLVGAGGPNVDASAVSRPPVSGPPAGVAAVPPSSRRSAGDRFGRFAIVVTIIGVLIHLTSITIRGVAVDTVPWSNMYEFSSVVGLIAVISFLIAMARMPQIRYLGLFILGPVVVVMFLAGTVLYSQASPLVPALQSYWLAIHVTAAASSEGVLMTSSVLTILYLVRTRYDARVAAGLPVPFIGGIAPKLSVPATLDKVAYRLAAFAFPLYTFGIICGAIWAEAAWGRYWGWDPKETWAFIAWVVYACYLHARATAGMRKWAPWINLLGFGAMTFNFFVVNIFISGLHSYAGLN